MILQREELYFYLRVFHYHCVDTSAGELLVLEDIT